VWFAAVCAALLHVTPIVRAQTQAPAGWRFTGNVRVSPDYMQYRVWTNEARRSGPIIRNSLTPEKNSPHLPVFFYWMVARVSSAMGALDGFVIAGFGAVFAFALTILLFCLVRQFFDSSHQIWWVFMAILVGGGVGAHLRVLTGLPFVSELSLVRRFITEALYTSITPEDHRGGYVIVAMFDAHYLLVWLMTTAAVTSLFLALRTPAWWRFGLTAILHGAITALHIYEGLTLIAIGLGIVALCWRRNVERRATLIGFLTVVTSTVTVLLWCVWLFRSGGLPITHWRAPHILLSTVLIAQPIAWPILAWGVGGLWRRADFKDLFLMGWVLGCLVLTLSSPFYPYPDRGMMTLAVPALILAGRVYFARTPVLSPGAALIVVVVMAVTPLWMLQRVWKNSAFTPERPYVFMSPAHQEIAAAVRERATFDDLLLAPEPDLLWLAPEYPGRNFCAHFFLTVDYARKHAEVARFYAGNPAEQVAFLRSHGIRHVYVPAVQRPERFGGIPGLTLLRAAPVGWLFEHDAQKPGRPVYVSNADHLRGSGGETWLVVARKP
jgi:hypothetical protein